MVPDQINMETKKLAFLLLGAAILIGLIAVSFKYLGGAKNWKKTQSTTEKTNEVKFVVVRVLPTGFAPKEVSIQKGMIVRFTNPVNTAVTLKWDGQTQYTTTPITLGNDVATSVFDKEGTYTYMDSMNHKGTVVVNQ